MKSYRFVLSGLFLISIWGLLNSCKPNIATLTAPPTLNTATVTPTNTLSTANTSTSTSTPLSTATSTVTQTVTATATVTSTATGEIVSTYAGTVGTSGFANGTGTAAKFSYPSGVAIDSSGNIYVADADNDLIREIAPGGVVTTLAGLTGTTGSTNGSTSVATFNDPDNVAADASGNIYVTDANNNAIRKISGGVVSTLASGLNGPEGLGVDASGNVYVVEPAGDVVIKITSGGVASTFAGSGSIGSTNGTGTGASFYAPWGLAVDASGNIFVADTLNNMIRKITPGAVVSTLAGSGAAGFLNGTGTAAAFNGPWGVAVDSSGNVYVADTTNYVIRKITSGGVVTTLAGVPGTYGSTNGAAASAKFNNPEGVAVDSSGNVYVADITNQEIREIQ